MDDVLSLLKSCIEPWLSFGSEYLGAVPSFILLNVVGLLLLYLCYLLLPTKHPGRATTKRKGGTFRGWRSHKREAEERKKLLNILKRPLGHHHDSTHFRHMLCPDPSCEVCNRTTAEIQQLLSQESLQDAALSEYFSSSTDSMIETSVCLTSDLSTIPPGDATAFPLAEPSPPPCSTVSTNLDTSCEDFISPSNLGDSLPPELTPCLDFSFPGRHVLLQPPGIPTPPPKTKDIHSTNLAALEIWNQAHTKDLPTSNLAQGDAKKNILALHSSKASSGVAPTSVLSAPNLSLLSQSCKAHIPVSILPGEFSLNSEIREKLEHHLQKRLVQYQCGLPRRVCESLSLVSIQSDISGTSESKSNQGLSGICLFKDQSIRDTVVLKLSPPGSFCERILGMLLPEKGERMVSLSGNNSRTSWMSLNQQKCKNALETHLKRKVMEIKENHIPRIVYKSLHSLKHSWASEKPCSQEHQDLAKVISVASNIDTSCQLAFLGPSKQKMLEDHIQNYHDRITWGLPEKVLEITELFKMKENSQAGVSRPCTQSSMFLHGDKVRRISVTSSDHQFSATSPIYKPFREGSVALHEDKARTRTSVPSLNRHVSATSAVCKHSKGDCTALHGDKARTRISVSSPNRHVSATLPMCKPYRESSMALHEHNMKPKTSVPSLNCHVSATSPICKPYRESSVALHEDKARTRTSVPSLNRHVSATSAVCKPSKGDRTALHEDKKRTRMPVPSVDRPFCVTSAAHKISNKGGPIALHGDKERAIISVPGVDYHLPSTSLVIKANICALSGQLAKGRQYSLSIPNFDNALTRSSCKPP
ncbi:spermatogenesis-associated protein 31D1-like [Ochotona princeps]|uniref:spermatogenesis-associated protein 31D1-like n=1 Tax=Ochotona princeps TaxID=9978 RepID=UPI002714745F|nr:spermatogenesis-associated protein 31D1-like [Ochotona princeps]